MIMVLTLLILFAPLPAAGQLPQDIQRSHVEANVPAPADFHLLLRRDLGRYFEQTRKQEAIPVEFELLRDGPTQSGASYPKFYVWVRVDGGDSLDDRGAVRVAAIERERFEVTDFISEREILSDRNRIRLVFPEPVCERIESMVGGAIPPPQSPGPSGRRRHQGG